METKIENQQNEDSSRIEDWVKKHSSDKKSKSRVVIEKISKILDYVSWAIIAVFVWIWWNAKGVKTDCTFEKCVELYSNFCGGGLPI